MERLPQALKKDPQNSQLLHETERALRTVLNGVERDFSKWERKYEQDDLQRYNENLGSGTTAVVVIVKEDGTVVVANVGDSRAIMSQQRAGGGQGRVVQQLSVDHKPDTEEERQRVVRAGGTVSREVVAGVGVGPYRVWTAAGKGGLSLTRSIGDFRLKDPSCKGGLIQEGGAPIVSWTPDVTVDQMHVREGGSEWVVLASDGVWDVVSNEEAITIATDVLEGMSTAEEKNNNKNAGVAQAVSDAIVRAAFQRGSEDNITALVVRVETERSVEERADGSMISDIDRGMQELRAKQSKIEQKLAAAKTRARQATMTRAEFMEWMDKEDVEQE
jgi:serine/threonine protein phosphatase PrpC